MIKYKVMLRKIVIFFLFFFFMSNSAFTQTPMFLQRLGVNNLEPFRKNDRILILAPHPDDETIGCAGIIQQALNIGAKVKIVYLTSGDANEFAFIVYEKRLTLKKNELIHMGEVRQQEARNAMKLLGLNESDLVFLGYPDFGTFTIFRYFWQKQKPFKSLLTRVSYVPYKEALSFGAPYIPENILADLKKVLLEYKPNKIFVSHPADVNADHRAFYLFLEVALGDLKDDLPRPEIYPYLIHYVGWPLPRHYHPELPLLPPKQFSDSLILWREYELSKEQLERKRQAILCYRSQTESSAFYLLAFARRNELFGGYPEFELTMQTPQFPRDNQLSLKERLLNLFGILKGKNIPIVTNPEEISENKVKISYALENNYFIIHLNKAKEKFRHLSAVFYLYGYSYKVPFAQMPKIRIITRYNKFKIFDAKRKIRTEEVGLELLSNELILKIPLKILGNPDFILTSLKSYTGITQKVNTTAFLKINIKTE
jgi:LmbE family N-acetylglucosaminyl deacetylase